MVSGSDPMAEELLAAMEREVEATLGPVTPERTSVVSLEEMTPPAGAYVVVIDDGVAVAGGGVRRLADGVAEIKRMYTVESARGRGHGRRLLVGLEDAARSLGYARVRLDTAATMGPALALYTSSGYVAIGDYNGNGYAAFWGEKELGPAR
jgi:GNAT superfamily N-acetyltransferase